MKQNNILIGQDNTLSHFGIAQILDLIVHVIEQNTGMKTILRTLLERQLVFLTPLILAELYLAHLVVNGRMHSISFRKLYRLKRVVQLSLAMRPTPPVRTDHVGTVSDGSKDKGVVFSLDHFLKAKADSQPVACELVDNKTKCFFRVRLYFRLHQGKFIPLATNCFDFTARQQFDILVLESR